MKLQKNTWISILTAIVLSCWVYFYEIPQGKLQQQAEENSQQKLFDFQEQNIDKIIINKPETTLEFVATKNQDYAWQMVKPENVPVNDGVMAFLIDLLVKGESDRILQVDSTSLSSYGLDKPLATITVELNDGKTNKILLGKPSIGDRFLYAQVITDQSVNSIVLVPKNWQYAVERELQEWMRDSFKTGRRGD